MNRRYSVLILGILFIGVGVVMIAVGAFAKDSEVTSKAFLGVVLDEVTSDVAKEYGATSGGALIQEVTSRSAAKKAGLRANDIIVKLDGKSIGNPDDLRKVLQSKSPGDEVELTFLRDGAQKTVDVKLGKHKSKKIVMKCDGDNDWTINAPGKCKSHARGKCDPAKCKTMCKGAKQAYAGIHLQELSGGLAKYFEAEEGVLISDVEEDSPAKKAGLEAGDVVVKIDGETTENSQDVQRWVRKHKPGETAKFDILRKGKKKTINVELGESKESQHFGWLGAPGGPMMVFDDEDKEEFSGNFEHFFHEFDVDEFKDDVNEFRIELQRDLEPQLEELKAQLHALKEELRQLKKEKFGE
jgi:hypothetical protein